MDKYTKPVTAMLEAEEEPATLPDNAALLAAIHSSRETLEGGIGEVRSEDTLIRQALRNVTDRVTAAETRISNLEDTVSTFRKEASREQVRLREVAWRGDDTEKRACHNNLRFVGFPEGAERSNCRDFLESWLLTTFGPNIFSTCFAVERAHRALGGRPPAGAPPHSVIAKYINYHNPYL